MKTTKKTVKTTTILPLPLDSKVRAALQSEADLNKRTLTAHIQFLLEKHVGATNLKTKNETNKTNKQDNKTKTNKQVKRTAKVTKEDPVKWKISPKLPDSWGKIT